MSFDAHRSATLPSTASSLGAPHAPAPPAARVAVPSASARAALDRRGLLAGLAFLAATPAAHAARSEQDASSAPAAEDATDPAGAGSAATSRFATVLLVRHAEKAADSPEDPSLSDAGRERARALADLLGALPSATLHATPFRRTRETLAPLAERLGVEPAVYDPRDLASFARALGDAAAGGTIVVAGHSNTVPFLAKLLGAELGDLDERGFLQDAEYGRLIALTVERADPSAPPRAVSALELRY